jgi:hypothetical protein
MERKPSFSKGSTMGFSLSWLAVRGKDRADVLKALEVSGTGSYSEVPDSPLQGALLSNGWYLVLANRYDFAEEEAPLADLSKGSEIVTCSVEEHVTRSSATGWKRGTLLWSIFHDAEEGHESLHEEGNLPPIFFDIRDNLLGAQRNDSEVDYIFEVPIQVAEAITGFKHDQDVPEPGFETLEEQSSEEIITEYTD